MTLESEDRKGALKSLDGIKRRSLTVSTKSLVAMRPLFPDGDLPLLVEPAMPGLDLATWAADHRDELSEKLLEVGGILFRGFSVTEPVQLEEIIRAVSGSTLEYRERSSPRHTVSGNIYTSTDYPPSYPIFLHNENSYQSSWPLRIFFVCRREAQEGGATPIADGRRVLRRIDLEVRDRFAAKGCMYVRNFGDGFGLTWQTVFQTSDKSQVEAHCRKSGIEIEWKEGDRLRTRTVRPAFARHPKTGGALWFNHATFFHVTTLEPEIRDGLLAEFGEQDLPAHSFFGDGSPIEPEVAEHLRAAYRAETVSFPWQKGDLLMLDNMMVSHGRAAFSGEREVVVGMAEPVAREDARV